MRQASIAAQQFFASRAPGFYADLFTITLLDGTIFRWCSLDISVTYGSNTWLATGPMLQRSAISVRNTVEVPNLTVKLLALNNDFVGGTNIKTQLHNGEFDGARLELDRLPMTYPGDTSLGPPIQMYAGRVGKAQITSVGAELSIRGDVVIMNQYAPRNVFQTSCQWAFCDQGCTLSAASFTSTNADAGGSTISVINWASAPPAAPSAYLHGVIAFTSGVNAGESRSINGYSSSAVSVTYPFLQPSSAGDTFTLFQGCDKTYNTSSGQDCTFYANTQHYRGFPFIPPAEYSA